MRWFGVWNEKVEIGYENIYAGDNKPKIGKLYFDGAEELSKKIEMALGILGRYEEV